MRRSTMMSGRSIKVSILWRSSAIGRSFIARVLLAIPRTTTATKPRVVMTMLFLAVTGCRCTVAGCAVSTTPAVCVVLRRRVIARLAVRVTATVRRLSRVVVTIRRPGVFYIALVGILTIGSRRWLMVSIRIGLSSTSIMMSSGGSVTMSISLTASTCSIIMAASNRNWLRKWSALRSISPAVRATGAEAWLTWKLARHEI
jgi:hypothetical protein